MAITGGSTNNFILEIDEEISTLLMFDVVNLDGTVQEDLLNSIKKEGILLYEKYENFIQVLRNLEDIYNYEEPYNNVIITGLVGLYEICFEQCWKAMKEILETHGFQESKVGSPRKIIKTAYKADMICDEKSWLDALVARNNVAHAYNKAIALDIVNETKNTYVPMFRKLEETLKEDWILED